MSVISGSCYFLCARADGSVEERILSEEYTTVAVREGDVYMYRNASSENPVQLLDVAQPAFKDGDEIALTSSSVPESGDERQRLTQTARNNHTKSCIVRGTNNEWREVELPDAWWDRVAEFMNKETAYVSR